MAHTAVVTFTARNADLIVKQGGSQAWRLDADRARRSEFLVCTQNRHNSDGFGDPRAEHGAAFLIGRIVDVVPSRPPEPSDRWLITISEYTECDIRNIWGKSGHRRYPVWYTTLEELGIDLAALPPFRTLPVHDHVGGFADFASPPPVLPVASPAREWRPGDWTARPPARAPAAVGARAAGHPATPEADEAWQRLDAILAQLDRVPDLPTPDNPLDWDAHGLPR